MLDQRGKLLRAAVGFAGCSTRSSDHALGKQHNLKGRTATSAANYALFALILYDE
jgi:hypothetical protein